VGGAAQQMFMACPELLAIFRQLKIGTSQNKPSFVIAKKVITALPRQKFK